MKNHDDNLALTPKCRSQVKENGKDNKLEGVTLPDTQFIPR